MYTLQQWTSGLGFKIKEGWRAWIVLDQVSIQYVNMPYTKSSQPVKLMFLQVAGYVTEYVDNDFKFVTVKGSGHMVYCILQ